MKKNKRIKLNLSTITSALKKIYQIRKEYIWVLIGYAILQAIRPFIPIIISAKILDELLGDKDVDKLMIMAISLVSFMLITHIISSYFIKKYNDESKLLINSYYFELSKKSMTMEYAYIEKKETMDLLHQIEGAATSWMAIWNIAEYMQKGLLAIIEIAIAVVLIMTMLTGSVAVVTAEVVFIQSKLAVVALLAVLVFGLYLYSVIQARIGETAAKDMQSGIAGNRVFGYLFFWMTNNYEHGKDIRIYSAQDLLHSKIKGYVKGNYHDCDEHYVKPNVKHFSLLNIVNVVMLMAVYCFIILKAYVGAITVGTIFIQINAIMKLYDSVGSFLTQYNMLKAACEHFKYSIEFFELPESKKDGKKEIEVCDTYVFEFKDVSFNYPGTDTLVLDQIDLTIKAGERLAVVGMNGAGKTTMIKLLCRLYEPTSGIITLNGTNIQDYDFDAYINLFSVVFQDFQLFAFEMDKNVATGNDINNKALENALKNAGLSNVIETMNNDFKVPLGKKYEEEGRDFSGGEKQKLAIARALYRNAPVVILDEPTAALDPIAEYEIYTKFDALVENKTAVFISHRLSSCRFCHDIAVFHKGKIVQHGNHEALLKNHNGKYYELWNAQAEHYIYEQAN
ncbi:MAG: ABC transporter ATP-binding protein [Clostridiales bacterium]|nr:ABC transporter ATP-binding protein [Clostridiales bacterium]